ncbi:hypothetical protein AB0E08_08265 [Streptomyces sp. NPDC048281]|uniref:hypothetical protein n=1 Tax=Streptomyces sp. NPDC048281 TaxID=3154715 RepID=UPI00342591B0
MAVSSLALVGTLVWNRPVLFITFAVVSAGALVLTLLASRSKSAPEPASTAWGWTALTLDLLATAAALLFLYRVSGNPSAGADRVADGPSVQAVVTLAAALLAAMFWLYSHSRSTRTPAPAPAAQ